MTNLALKESVIDENTLFELVETENGQYLPVSDKSTANKTFSFKRPNQALVKAQDLHDKALKRQRIEKDSISDVITVDSSTTTPLVSCQATHVPQPSQVSQVPVPFM